MDKDKLHSKSHNTPCDGAELYGKVCATIKGGKLTYQAENLSLIHISALGMDHVKELGPTLADIAAAKAGIIKEGCPVVSYGGAPEALSLIHISTPLPAAARSQAC